MTPRSRGTLTLRSADPTLPPRIDHRYLSDPDGADVAVLADGLARGRELAAQPAPAALLGKELLPGPNARTAADLAAFARETVAHYYHPVGTCAMGPASDPAAVVDGRGKIHGLANAYVADASIMPVVPRANTNVPALVVGLRIAAWLAED
jgi:choline dehydrogenase